MISRTILVLLAAATLSQAASPTRSPEKLRSLALLPSMTVNLRIGVEELRRPELSLRTNELPQKITALEKQMQKSPGDAERYMLIGTYQNTLGQKEACKAAFSNAAGLYRLRAEGRPQDGPLQARFAEALVESGSVDEAERVLRAAIRAVPEDWTCWAALGQRLDEKSTITLFGGTNNLTGPMPLGNSLAEVQRRLKNPPTSEEVKEADSYLAEADKCFDTAVSLGKKVSQAHLARALHRSWNVMFRQMISQMRGMQKFGEKEFFATIASPEACADWANAARLTTTNYLIIGNWGWAESLPAIIENLGDNPLNALPESRRKNVLEAMRMLEDLGESRNTRTAAGAMEALGILRYMVSAEKAVAKTAFRRAVTLDPLRPQSWDGLIIVAVEDSDPQQLLSVCEERLKHDDTPQNRVSAAKACDRAKQYDKALAHARTAVKLDPDSPLARITLGALLVRRADDELNRAEAIKQFRRVVRLLQAPDVADHDELAVVARVNMAIIDALEGYPERARESLKEILDSEAANDQIKEHIKEIQTVLGD